MNYPSHRSHSRFTKILYTSWLFVAAGLVIIVCQLAGPGPLSWHPIAVGQAAGVEFAMPGRFEAVQVGTPTATVRSPATTLPAPGTPQATTEPGRTPAPGETAVPTATETPRSPAAGETTVLPPGPTATQAGIEVSMPTALVPPATGYAVPAVVTTSPPVKPGTPAGGTSAVAPSGTGATGGALPAQTQAGTAPVSTPAAPLTPGPPTSGASPPAAAAGVSGLPLVAILGLVVVVGSGVVAYMVGRRG